MGVFLLADTVSQQLPISSDSPISIALMITIISGAVYIMSRLGKIDQKITAIHGQFSVVNTKIDQLKTDVCSLQDDSTWSMRNRGNTKPGGTHKDRKAQNQEEEE